MLHSSIESVYLKQKRLFQRLVSMAFTCAGFYWVFIYAAQFLDALTHDDVLVLRSGQTMIYFVLLMVWGLEYMREVRRYRIIMNLANTRGVPPSAITSDLLEQAIGKFAVLRPIGKQSYLAPALNLVSLAASYVLIGIQYVKLLQQLTIS